VFAAYLNYNKADNGGSGDKMMNTPGVLLTDAVMFALGGSHLELGDHMLSREYFRLPHWP
jgi:dextranase